MWDHRVLSNGERLEFPVTRRAVLKLLGAGAAGLMAGCGPMGQMAVVQSALRRKQLSVLRELPLSASPNLQALVRDWITPVEYFFTRNHGPIPSVDPRQFRLEVSGRVDAPLSLGLEDLKTKFEKQTITATLACAGNRRAEHSRARAVEGVQWGSAAIGNARWTGVRLSEVLRAAGLHAGARHVWFEGLDEATEEDRAVPFGGSIPIDKALSDTWSSPGALLAYEMNGKPLAAEHGYPLRGLVPGFIGARSVKWLGRIVVADRPSDNHYVARDFKLVGEDTEAQWTAAPPIYRYPINSVICEPAAGSRLSPGVAKIRGYALATGAPGRTIEQVEVSADGGATWVLAGFAGPANEYCWRLWEADVDVGTSTRRLMVRATDSAGQVQPRRMEWNLKGYLFNAWHRISVEVS